MIDFSKREMSSFPLSIGTGLMFESIFKPTTDRYDKDRVIPNTIKADDYQYHLINLLLLARNIITSFPLQKPNVVLKDKGFSNALMEEVNIISSLYSSTKCVPIFYLSDFKRIYDIYNKTKTREDTEVIKLHMEIYDAIKKINIKKTWLAGADIDIDVVKLDNFGSKKNIITTNVSCDLCSKNNIELLDSHTGILYEKSEFYKRYQSIGSKDMSVFPFKERLLFYLGNKVMSKIITPKIRLYLHELAVSKKWNKLTSDFEVDKTLRTDKDLKIYYNDFKPIY